MDQQDKTPDTEPILKKSNGKWDNSETAMAAIALIGVAGIIAGGVLQSAEVAIAGIGTAGTIGGVVLGKKLAG